MVVRLPPSVISANAAAPPTVSATSDSVASFYPLQLGLAYLFLVGYLVRTVFVCAGLPSSVGVILIGFVFSYFFQFELLSARDQLQELSFFLVLLTAGLEIRLTDLRTYIFVMAFLPATCELLAIALYGVLVLEFAPMEGLVLGTILVAIGDGLVIPKMKEFGYIFKGHPMPRLMFTWAPLEASFALATFGVLSGFAAPVDASVSVGTLLAGNALRIFATVVGGMILGGAAGWLIPRRTKLTIGGKQVFTGMPVEAFLMVVSVALAAFALGVADSGSTLVPMPMIGGAFFQSELMVIMTGVFFSAMAPEVDLHQVERVMGGVWIFGQLILFSMIGSRTTLDIFPAFWHHVFPIMACGLAARLLGIFAAINGILILDLPGHPFQPSMVMQDVAFCFLSVLPRATIQGALGQVPITQQFFGKLYNSSTCQDFIFLAARLYICIMSVFGMILLNTFGHRLCMQTIDRPQGGKADAAKGLEGGLESPDAPESLMQSIAEAYAIPEQALQQAVQKLVDAHSGGETPVRSKSHSGALGRRAGNELSSDLAFAQFDCLGSVLNSREDEEPAWRGRRA
mmetsp:Transcript_6550/g.15147  ORF Transcript_6550/g.15147 Transcript_6550/m.15147 type:complete len:570 (+) Transcript_6550:42-1751(+)